MSYLDKLLEGVEVEWKPLARNENAVAELCRGRVMSKSFLEENIGIYPVYSSQTANNGEIGNINTFDFDGEAVTWTTDGANAGTVFHRTGKFSITNVCGLIKILEPNKLNYRFLFYWLSIEAKKYVYSGMGNPKLMSHQMEKIQIPIPCPENPKKSLEIQTEIVRILDTFTEHTETLINELTTELEARKKQYSYYREKLLSFKEGEVKWKTLGEVILSLKTGLNPRQNFQLNTNDATGFYVTVREIQNGNIKFSEKTDRVNERAIELINNRSNLDAGDILFSGTGTVGRTAVIYKKPVDWNIKEGVYVIKPIPQIINSKYLSHLLNTNYIIKEYSKKIVGSPVISLPMNDFKKLSIPIPSIEEQERIVVILDKLENLTTSISEVLPKEIALRKKQYEYYRDRLLTFK